MFFMFAQLYVRARLEETQFLYKNYVDYDLIYMKMQNYVINVIMDMK